MSVAIDLPIERFTLACGARLLVSPRPGAPVTGVQVHLRGGHSLDAPGREGTAFLAGALVDQGTARHDEEELAALLESAGGQVSGDATGLSGSIASSASRRLFELVAEMLVSPSYPSAEVERQRQRLLDRLLVERDEPRVQGERLFKELVYGDHWLARAPYGTLASVPRVRRADIAAHHARHWLARRAIIAVCGDVEPREVRAAFERRLARWKPGEDLPQLEVSPPPRGVRCATFEAQREQVHVFLGHLGIRRNHPDYAALVVMDHVLGTGPGFTNRIAMRLRDELGLAYTVHANIHGSAGIHPGTFTAYIGTSPDKLATALEGFVREIRRIQDEPVGEDELATAAQYVIGSFALAFQRSARRAHYMVSAERFDLPPDHLERFPREIAAVTPEDVQRVARAHLHPDACCVAVAGPVSTARLRSIVEQALGATGARAVAVHAARSARG